LSPTQYILVGGGVLAILITIGLQYIVLNKAQVAAGVILGILLIIFGFALPVIQDKQK
jgi:sulfite exporter TauE/SafE